MIQKLAIMVRQNVDWSSDSNTIKRELAFVEAYLSLQNIASGSAFRIKSMRRKIARTSWFRN